jgi:hypothetical protein
VTFATCSAAFWLASLRRGRIRRVWHRFGRNHLDFMRITASIGFAMKFTAILDELVNRVDQGAKLADLKAYVMSVYEQAEAADEENENSVAGIAEELAHYKNLYAEEAYKNAKLQPAQAEGELGPQALEVLKLLGNADQMGPMHVTRLIPGMKANVAEMFLNELVDAKLAAGIPQIGHMGEMYLLYRITPLGTRYLYDRGLVK